MTVWDMGTVKAVARMYYQFAVSTEMEARMSEDIDTLARPKSALIDAARIHAVDLHPDDIRVVDTDIDEDRGIRTRKVAWRPQTDLVELRAPGADDGQLLHIQGAPAAPFFSATPVDLRLHWCPQPDALVTQVDVSKVEWEVSGWSETKRHWIYSPRG